jgi:hypothetical protein
MNQRYINQALLCLAKFVWTSILLVILIFTVLLAKVWHFHTLLIIIMCFCFLLIALYEILGYSQEMFKALRKEKK